MKKISFLVIATALVLGFMSCSNGSDDSTASTSSVPTLENGTYKTADNAFDSDTTITLVKTSTDLKMAKVRGASTEGPTVISVDGTTGKFTFGGSDYYLTKNGNKIYVAAIPSDTTNESLNTTWEWSNGNKIKIIDGSSCQVTNNGQTVDGTYTSASGVVTVSGTVGGQTKTMKFLFSNKKLYTKFAEITKQ